MVNDSLYSKDKSKSTPGGSEIYKGKDNIAQLTAQMQPEGLPMPSNIQEISKQHLVVAGVEQELDTHIARRTAEKDSRIQGRELRKEDILIAKGDAGEGRTYIALLELYEPEQIDHQPCFTTDTGKGVKPDFVVCRDKQSDELIEVVDSKAWSLLCPKDTQGNPLSREDFFRYLQQHPNADSLLYMKNLQNTVENYACTPQLATDGKVILYFPENVMRYAPQIKQRIESWSGSEVANGHEVEVRSMGVWDDDLWIDVNKRYKDSRK